MTYTPISIQSVSDPSALKSHPEDLVSELCLIQLYQSAHPPTAEPETGASLPGLDLESDPGNRKQSQCEEAESGWGWCALWCSIPKELYKMCFRGREVAGGGRCMEPSPSLMFCGGSHGCSLPTVLGCAWRAQSGVTWAPHPSAREKPREGGRGVWYRARSGWNRLLHPWLK